MYMSHCWEEQCTGQCRLQRLLWEIDRRDEQRRLPASRDYPDTSSACICIPKYSEVLPPKLSVEAR